MGDKNFCQLVGLSTTVFCIAVLLVVSGCSSTAQVRSAPDANVAGYETFGFISDLGTDRSGYSSFLSNSLKSATRAALEGKGYTFSDTNPQLLVNFNAKSQQKTEVDPAMGMAPGFYGYRAGLYGGWAGYDPIDQYDEGTIVMDLVDASKQKLLWEGSTNIRKNDISKWTDADVQKMVQTIVAQVPPAQ